MAISTTKSTQQFTLDQVTDEFDFSFPALVGNESDIKCAVLTNGTQYLLSYPTDFTVEILADNSGGTVTLDDATAVSKGTLTVYRETTNLQESDYEDYNQFPADVVETDLDKRTMIDQEQSEILGRSVKVPISTGLSGLETPVPSAGKGLIWNATEDGLDNSTININDYETELAAAVAEASGYADDADTSATNAEASNVASASEATTALNSASVATSEATTSASHATTATAQTAEVVSEGTTYLNATASEATTAIAQVSLATTQATISSSHATTALTAQSASASHATTAEYWGRTAGTYSTISGSHATTSLAGATAASTSAITAGSYATIAQSSVLNLTTLTVGTLNVTTASVGTMTVSTISVVTDIHTVPWTDYSGSSTITGWVTAGGVIMCKKIGKTVFVTYELYGTSNSTATSFTVPYPSVAGNPTYLYAPIGYAVNNGANIAGVGMLEFQAGTQVVTFYTTNDSGAWTNSGGKTIKGQFWYETA